MTIVTGYDLALLGVNYVNSNTIIMGSIVVIVADFDIRYNKFSEDAFSGLESRLPFMYEDHLMRILMFS